MSWCRILEAEEGPYLMVAAEGPEGWGIVTSWMTGTGMMNALLPATEFRGKADCMEFLHAANLENARTMRRATEEALAMSVAQEAIESAMRGGSVH